MSRIKNNFYKFVSNNWVLIVVVIVSALLRFYKISDNPPSLNWDEVSHGYNAYSILKTGKDEWGMVLPIIFRAYGDYKLPVYIYTTVVSVALFGLNTFAARLPSVLAGISSVVFTYLLVGELFKRKSYRSPITDHSPSQRLSRVGDRSLATIASLLVAVEPWSLFLSRGAFEANLALTFIIAGVYFFLRGLHSTYYILLSTILLGFSVWTYNSARIFVPLFLAFLIFVYRKQFLVFLNRSKKHTTYYVLLTAFFFLPMFYQLLSPSGQARYGWVSVIDEGAIAQINEARGNSNLSPGLSRLLHNKGTFFVNRFVRNWASHYSADFLFFKGGSDYQFNVPGRGLIYPINAIFLIVGVIVLLKRRDKTAAIILGWFYFGSIASSLTREAPHTLRAITMLPSPMILTAVGFVASAKFLKRKLTINNKPLTIIYLIIIAVFSGNYLRVYFNEYRNSYSWSWQYGYKEVVEHIKENYNNYENIVFSKKYGEPHEFILYYWPWDPASYRSDESLLRFHQSNWYWVDRFDKFWFVNDWEVVRDTGNGIRETEYGKRNMNYEFVLESGGAVDCNPLNASCLLITSPGNVPKGWAKLETINFLDGKPAFEIYEN